MAHMDFACGASPLGRVSDYAQRYDAQLLCPIPRSLKRTEIGVADTLLFTGVDIWNSYEMSWLNPRGKPVVAVATFWVPAESPHIVESKSFKLYLNSFNQTMFADTAAVIATIRNDLSQVTGAPVRVQLHTPDTFTTLQMATLDGQLLDILDIEANRYDLAPDLLTTVEQPAVAETLVSHLLKSNCLVTGQPDWASVQIHYRGAPIQHAGLLQYLISFRQHMEFHEQCVERIFMDILRQCRPQQLSVYARYTRRGGLDINPYRTNFSGPLPSNARTARQ